MTTPRRNVAILAAGLAAVLVLVSGGAGYRLLARHLSQPSENVPLPPGTLGRLPMRLGAWIGQDAPLDDSVVAATGTDDHVSRRYAGGGQVEPIVLYAACSRARGFLKHNPEVCYPGAGWTMQERNPVTVKLADGSDLPCRLYRFSCVRPVPRTIAVISFFVVDGRYLPDLAELRTMNLPGRKVHYVTQVQLVVGAGLSFEKAVESLKELAAVAAPQIEMLLPDREASTSDGGDVASTGDAVE